jgi:NAD(P)-dependent dehydrogenase (short-subunit alcohol dehydrogenase family)
MYLSGKTAIVTGGASGIGAAIAERFLAEGAEVLAVDLNPIKPRRGLQTLVADVSRPVSKLPKADILVCAAGISVGKTLADTSEEDWDHVFAVNAKGTFLWFKAVLPGMLERGAGSLIAIASQLAVAGPRSNCSYAASKGAVVSLVKSVALDYADRGIRANALLPGATETPLLERAFARRGDPQVARETLRKRHPAGRFGRPEEIAAAALFLASDESSFVTGAALPVDGGFLAG